MCSSERIQHLKQCFRGLDRNGDGTLDYNELATLLRSGNPEMTDEEVQLLFDSVDRNSDGRMNFGDFLSFVFTASPPDEGPSSRPSSGRPKPRKPKRRVRRKPRKEKVRRNTCAQRREPKKIDWKQEDQSRWRCEETLYNGSYMCKATPVVEEVREPISSGLEKLKAEPEQNLGLFYQTDMTGWPESSQMYRMVSRNGSGFTVKGNSGDAFTWVECTYRALDPDATVEPDQFTDDMSIRGQKCGQPVSPGRGQGYADVPRLTMIRDADPSDIKQGHVGDCWLLSAISALAEYDGAVSRLFRKTQDLKSLPQDVPQKYTVTLWDLPTWSEVDIEIDERLCVRPDGQGLLGAQPSADGELWTCYLEKAIAIHCGGWDKIEGGTSCHAFRMLLGCREQYFIARTAKGYVCRAHFMPWKGEWCELANSPHDCRGGLYNVPWPEIGGGGEAGEAIDHDDLFERLCLWEDENFIMCCDTRPGSDENDTEGIVDNHAYTILQVEQDVAGSGFNMIKVRNPWGKGEFKSGRWDDDGPGWQEFPDVRDELEPKQVLDGTFWLEESEFFEYFHNIYLCAKNMKELLQEG